FFLAKSSGCLTRLRMATARQARPSRPSGAKSFCYACKIKETTNGGWRSALGQTRKTFQEIAARRIERNVQIDEQSRTAASGQNQAQEFADAKTKTPITKAFCGGRNCSDWKTPERWR